MIDKNKVIQLKGKGLSFQAIGTLMGVSRARIHQIYSGYKPQNLYYKKFILKRDNNKCQWGKCCNEKEKNSLIIHHIDGDNENNRLSNLITLCRSCHSYFHKTKWEENYKN